MRRLVLSLAAAALVAAAAAPAPVRADTQDVVAAAQEEFMKGREAFKRGDYAAARVLFQKSYDMHPTPGALLNLALCEEELGLIASAWEKFQELTTELPPSDERYRAAKQHAAALEPRLPKLRIELAPDAPAGTKVRRGTIAVAGKSLGAELPVDPGTHTIVVRAPGRKERRYEVTLGEGQRESLVVEPGGAAVKRPGTPPPVATGTGSGAVPPPLPPPSSNGRRTAGFILGGVGIAGLVVGGVTGGLTLAKAGKVEDMCPVPDRCTRDGVTVADSAWTLSTVSTVSFIAGTALVGTGLVLVLTGRSGSGAETALAPAVLPGGGGLAARGRF